MTSDRRAIVPMLPQQKERGGITPARRKSSLYATGFVPMRKSNMRRGHVQSNKAKLLGELAIGIATARRSLLAAALGILVLASAATETAHAQEYRWCLSRESYLDCAYTTHQQCQWTASGIGGCALNPRLLFFNTPRYPMRSLRTGSNRTESPELHVFLGSACEMARTTSICTLGGRSFHPQRAAV